jgi:hypothetical protein
MDARSQVLGDRGDSSWGMRSALARASSAANQLQSISSLEQSQRCHIVYVVTMPVRQTLLAGVHRFPTKLHASD